MLFFKESPYFDNDWGDVDEEIDIINDDMSNVVIGLGLCINDGLGHENDDPHSNEDFCLEWGIFNANSIGRPCEKYFNGDENEDKVVTENDVCSTKDIVLVTEKIWLKAYSS